MNQRFIFGITIFILLVGGLAFGVFRYGSPKIEFEVGDFELQFKDNVWKFSEAAKDLNLVYIGYSKCPDVCPMSLSAIGQALKELEPKERSRVLGIFISVDHENDSSNDVAVYANQFDSLIVGLTGSQDKIDKVVNAFKASYVLEKNSNSKMGYSIAHTDRLYLLNRNGGVVYMISSPRDFKEIVKAIKEHF